MAGRDELFKQARSFARPKAIETDAAAARRIAVIDVGSNSVRLVVFDGIARSPAYFFNEKVLCGLGRGLASTGRLDPGGRARALATLRRFASLAERMDVKALEAVATAAVREAADGADFVAEVRRETGLEVRVASGDDEARLSAQGVLLGWPDADGLVVDMGGASMELARVGAGRVGQRLTTPLGPLPLRDRGLTGDALKNAIDGHLREARQRLPGPVPDLYLVGGSWRSLGRIHMARAGYPLAVLHEYRMEPGALRAEAQWMARQTPDLLDSIADISTSRADVLPLAATVLDRLIAVLQPERVAISGYGLREGVVWEHLPSSIRAQDPLLESCRFLEARGARFPGFGGELFAWLRPLLAGFDAEALRLAEAACLLHDVNWRTHPDYRPDMGFETMLRASIAGIDHAGRIFIGLALYHRYKSSRGGLPKAAALGLLEAGRQRQAERLGRAMRLGAMLSGSAKGGLEGAVLRVEGRELVLSLGLELRELAGEVVEKRLHSLARVMELAPRFRVA
ncbi:MAG TPA: Ppx/GppA family phosphatase [Paracoccaceae bacterium]|nr:Ppx/GppA family phosphatase [Paracoccaceae bacterium]